MLRAGSGLPSCFMICRSPSATGCPVLFTFAVLQLFLPEAADCPFIYYVPAVLFSSLMLARGSGLWAVALSAALIAVSSAVPSLAAAGMLLMLLPQERPSAGS